MAKSLAIASLQVLSVLLLASLGQSKTVFTSLTVYAHEIRSGDGQSIFPVAGPPNVTWGFDQFGTKKSGDGQSIFPVAGPPNVTWGFDQFGTVFVEDITLTQSASIESAVVGRSQGFAAVASPDKINILAATFLFTSGKYNGSTVDFKGTAIQGMDVNEVAIVGGTKQFRYATGYVIFELVSAVGDNLTIRTNLYIRQDIPDDYPGIALQ